MSFWPSMRFYFLDYHFFDNQATRRGFLHFLIILIFHKNYLFQFHNFEMMFSSSLWVTGIFPPGHFSFVKPIPVALHYCSISAWNPYFMILWGLLLWTSTAWTGNNPWVELGLGYRVAWKVSPPLQRSKNRTFSSASTKRAHNYPMGWGRNFHAADSRLDLVPLFMW